MNDNYNEPMGPTPMPSLTALRDWDMKLLTKYKPFYMPDCDLCAFHFLAMRFDSWKTRRMRIRHSNTIFSDCNVSLCNWAACHTAHSRHLLHSLIEKYGRRYPLNVGGLNIKVEAPVSARYRHKAWNTRRLRRHFNLHRRTITQVLAVGHTGQEGSNLDFESKAMQSVWLTT